MGLVNHTAKTFENVVGHAKLIQSAHCRTMFQQAHDHRSTGLCRHGGESYINIFFQHMEGETPVLWQAFLGDIHAAHQLEPGDHRRGNVLLLHHLLLQHPVDALADPQHLLVRFDMDVRGIDLDRVLEQGLQQFHHRGVGQRLDQDELRLGNLDAQRDWGYAGDYVKAMWAMLWTIFRERTVAETT